MEHFADISKEARIERWDNVLRVLEGLGPHERDEHWDMTTWGQKTACGTIACAAGHCGLDPWFRDQDFTMDFTPCSCGEPDCTEVHIKDVTAFFGRTGSEKIFHNSTERSVETVIEEVKAHLQELRS